ncbi:MULTISPECIES: DUF5082 family protein [Bacillus]|uniref:DUF5082 family protein n=1 Tax=Bacillus TaxID=1386 RepID=UPI001583B4E1|nr:DUF5082 family protein [Bacillus glycinifermentans]MBU8788663.1 DUF5082 domain-containing protein [Bacillus glycinifermentans]NUJ17536.1 DUF5082 domain-containing protein [Bacillus glycinifermentans]
MDYSGTLEKIHGVLSHKAQELEEQISRLERAKRDVEREQGLGIEEIRQILRPGLGEAWTGSRAADFDEARDEAHTAMYRIFNDDYERYIHKIDLKIFALDAEKGAVEAASWSADRADYLLEKGDEALDALHSTINGLKGWLK